MRESASRAGWKPMPRSALAYWCASSQTTSSGTAPSLHSPNSKARRNSTETMASNTSAGNPASCTIDISLVSPSRRRSWHRMSTIESPPAAGSSKMKA